MSEAAAHAGLPRLAVWSLADPEGYADLAKRAGVNSLLLALAGLVAFVLAHVAGPVVLSLASEKYPVVVPVQTMGLYGAQLWLWSVIALGLFAWISRANDMWFIDTQLEVALALLGLGVIMLIVVPLIYWLTYQSFAQCFARDTAQTYSHGFSLCAKRAGLLQNAMPVIHVALAARLYHGIAPSSGWAVALMAATATAVIWFAGPLLAGFLIG
jgi:hypothetical protein